MPGSEKELYGWDFFVIIKTLGMIHAGCGIIFCGKSAAIEGGDYTGRWD